MDSDLYKNYIDAKEKWLKYAYSEAKIKFNERLNFLNKKYSRNTCDAFVYKTKYESYTSQIKTEEKEPSKNSKKIYRKLSLLYHPDKFNKTDKIFILIGELLKEDNFDLLNFLDEITNDILDCSDENLKLFLEIIKDKEKIKKLKEYILISKTNFEDAINLFEQVQEIEQQKDEKEEKEDKISDCFMYSEEYKWYTGSKYTKEYYESRYFSDEELLNYINEDTDSIELMYYSEVVDKNILEKIVEIVKKTNQKLKEKNIILRNQEEEESSKKLEKLLENKDLYMCCYLLISMNIRYGNIDVLIPRYIEEFNFSKSCSKDVIELKNKQLNDFIKEKAKEEINKYINLAKPLKIDLNFYKNIIVIIENCYELIDIKEITDHIVEIIKNIDIDEWFFFDIRNMKNKDIRIAIENRYIELSKEITNLKLDEHHFRKYLKCENVSLRNSAMEKLKNEKDKYEELYKEYYN